MHRAFVSPDFLAQAQEGRDFELDAETAKRFTRVLRLLEGETVELFDGTGRVLTGVLHQTILKHTQLTQVTSKGPYIKLYQALVSMEKLEQITQHATELGVAEIILFKAERSQIDFKDKMSTKLERLTRIAQDASRQCGRAHVPGIYFEKSLRLQEQIFVATPGFFPPFEKRGVGGISVLIGPEGGFSPAELKSFQSAGAHEISLGPYVLRTETASLAALAQIQGAYL